MNSPIVSVSGVRGIVGMDISPAYASIIGRKFGSYTKGGRIAIATDTRTTSEVLKDSVTAGLLSSGCTVIDLGYSSTPSVFKEVHARRLQGGIVVTASHNPPEWNGLKFVISGGRGVFENELEEIIELTPSASFLQGKRFRRNALYMEILKSKVERRSASGVKVSLDLAGGVGSLFIPQLLAFQGCEVHTIHDTPGIFPRLIDPTADPLTALTHLIVSENCQVGFAFDCDADRLVIVDENGKKLSGDATLLICLEHFLENTRNRTVAVSVDTSLAVEDLVREYNGKILYTKVGEANVVKKILENDCGAGGEGSSGGYIEPSFVMCRDGVYASTIIAKMIRSQGSLQEILTRFVQYFQDRAKLEISGDVSKRILETLAQTEDDVDTTDGVKIRFAEKAWVLLRSSNTENVMRISAE
ncbi:MAG: phosphohexomutase domain-containing protein, partial [Nitrososphaerales archaeon]